MYRGLTTGAVTLVSAPGADLLMPAIAMAFSDDETVTVVPVSSEARHATEWDLVLDDSVLGYVAMAEVWNYGSVLPEQCREVVAVLDPNLLGALEQLVEAAVAGRSVPGHLAVGAPVLTDDDPRLLFQDAEAEAIHAYWRPVLKLAGAATLGEVVRHRRDELGDAAAVRELAGAADWLEPLERDELDIRRALPATTLRELFRRLGLGASARLRAIAATTIESASPAIARYGGTDDDVPVDTDTYLDAVFDDLENDA
jgi:hypothetical protein